MNNYMKSINYKDSIQNEKSPTWRAENEKQYFKTRSEMTLFAKNSGLEIIRCRQNCQHVPQAFRPAILLLKDKQIVKRLIRCKVCFLKQEGE